SLLSAFSLLTFVVTLVGIAHRFGGDPVSSFSPSRQVLQLTAFAAEGPPELLDRMAPAEHAERLRHGDYSILAPQPDPPSGPAAAVEVRMHSGPSGDSTRAGDYLLSTCPARPASPTGAALGGVVADVLRQDHEDHVFGDVRGVVADPLEVAGDQNQVQRRFDRGRILQHVGEELSENLG